MPISDEYAAGLIDGEGWVAVTRRYDRAGLTGRLCISVGMTHLPTLQALQDRFGGSITVHSACKKPNRKPAWIWRALGGTARQVVIAIRPHVITKRDAVEDCIRHLKEEGVW